MTPAERLARDTAALRAFVGAASTPGGITWDVAKFDEWVLFVKAHTYIAALLDNPCRHRGQPDLPDGPNLASIPAEYQPMLELFEVPE